MTTVVLKKKDNRYSGLLLTGHAGYADSGQDIVCSAISMLVINSINAMETLAGERMDVTADEREGRIAVSFPDAVNEKSQLILDTMVLGLKSVQEQYGKKYLKLKFEEV